jgi:hypothetical protein
MRDQHEVVCTGGRRDQQVVRADWPARALEIDPYEAGLLGAPVIEGQADERGEETAQHGQVRFDPAALPRAMKQLGLDDSRQSNLRRIGGLQARRQRR